MNYYITQVSRNKKLGPMPVATISADTCPSACPFNNGGGCYANYGPLAIHWNQITNALKGYGFKEFVARVRKLPNMMWRYGQAGDLPGQDDKIDRNELIELAKANRRRPVLCYTHKPLTEQNGNAMKEAEALGFHINVSTESLSEADEAIKRGFSAVTVIPSSYQRRKEENLSDYKERVKDLRTPGGVKVAICPATYTDTNCLSCGACSKRRAQNTVIAFPAHGIKRKTVDERQRAAMEVNHATTARNNPRGTVD